jgi:glucose-1-phosphate adenylyltransferase
MSEERAPAKIGATAQVHRSLISHGCVINGSVVNSVLSPGVVVDVGAVVRDSIVLFDSVIRPGAVVDRAILDKEVAVGPGAIVGEGTDYHEVNRREPGRLNTGITVVGKRAVIPRGVRIGRNVLIGEGVRATDFSSRLVRSGSTIERPRDRVMRPAPRAAVGKSPDGLAGASDGGSGASPHSVDDGGVGLGQGLRAVEAKD